jgi:hypothetical protein
MMPSTLVVKMHYTSRRAYARIEASSWTKLSGFIARTNPNGIQTAAVSVRGTGLTDDSASATVGRSKLEAIAATRRTAIVKSAVPMRGAHHHNVRPREPKRRLLKSSALAAYVLDSRSRVSSTFHRRQVASLGRIGRCVRLRRFHRRGR